ncbi:glycosyltransferase family 4 protein [Chloroflexota bacterium]
MLNYEFPPLGGGAANACEYIIRDMAQKGVEVDLVTSSPDGYKTEQIGSSINIYKLAVDKKSIHYWTHREILTYSWKARIFIKSLMKQRKYSLCHAFFGIPCGAIAYLYRQNLPYIVSLRGSDVPGFNKRFSFQYVFLKPVIRRVWRNAEAIIANSDGLKELAQKTDPDCEMGIIYNGIDIKQFKPDENRKNGGKLRVICVSRLIGRKGIDYLLQSIPRIKEKGGSPLELRIIGEGNQENQLKTLSRELGLEDTVSFAGYVEHSRLPVEYAASDIFVIPSFNEGMSNSILEAMACGLPIVATDTGGSKELIDGNGIIIPTGQIESITASLQALIEDSGKRTKMGRRSRQLAESLSWDKVTTAYINEYEKHGKS